MTITTVRNIVGKVKYSSGPSTMMTNGGAIMLRKARNQTRPVIPTTSDMDAVVHPTPV